VVDVEPSLRAQVVKQMNKLVNVLQASDLSESPAVTGRCCCCGSAAQMCEARTAILKEAEIFGARGGGSSSRDFRPNPRAPAGFPEKRGWRSFKNFRMFSGRAFTGGKSRRWAGNGAEFGFLLFVLC